MAPLPTSHVDAVIASVESKSAAARSRLAASWRRSMLSHGLDPSHDASPSYLTGRDVADRQDALGRVMEIAAPQLDRLYDLVGSSGCGVVLTDCDGVVVDHRFSDADQTVFEGWGLGLGAIWSEAAEGTNGIGTCITEERSVTIHRNDHFMARNTAMSCIDAPIFGAEGQLIAALDVSSARADQTQAINGLIAEMVSRIARTVEADNFRANFEQARIVVADHDDSTSSMLLAVDQDDVVIGATRGARKAYGLESQGKLTPLPASDLFGRGDGPVGFEKAERAVLVRALVRANNNVSVAARDLAVSRATLYRRMKRLGLNE
ncbi:GAF domain-containing protein [Octadecabacter sp. CECT 8868]|uniref:GAF domain-containing protein n=1 Tax=Octadecabacter algicola TaxID=2909342 RepID=UPI001F235F6C|nr:GAF domain-containing protein [Octadecabacter algicola]MCF2904683.1 GAF domain-containing protein [Octadecabacter algicola]